MKSNLRIVEAIDHNFSDEAEKLARLHVDGARRMIEQQVVRGEFTPKWVMDETTTKPARLKG